MKINLNNPLCFLYSRTEKNSFGNLKDFSEAKILIVTLPFFVLLLFGLTDICSCTLFASASFLQLLMIVFMVGHFSAISISSEREKRTLDSLRLTNLGPYGIVAGKILPEITGLFKIILLTSPFLILMGIFFPSISLITPFLVSLVSLGAGLTLIFGLTCLSACCSGVSYSIVLSWVLKAVWIFVTPLIDSLIATIFLRPSTTSIFSNLNPALPLLSLTMPECLSGTGWAWSSYLYPFMVPLFCLITFVLASIFIEKGCENKGNRCSKRGGLFIFGKDLNFLGILKNPLFYREMIPFKKGPAGLIPGILVFSILLLVPCFYCTSTAIRIHRGSSLITKPGHVYVQSQEKFGVNADTDNSGHGVTIRTDKGETFTLRGHSGTGCLRIMLYEYIALALPAGDMVAMRNPVNSNSLSAVINTDSYEISSGQDKSDISAGSNALFTDSAKEMITTENRTTLFGGFYAGLLFLLSYLVIRISGFLSSSYNTEKNKLTWDVLTLTQLSPENIVNGKLWGVLFFPLIQMTIGFFAVFFWIYKGVITLSAGISLYIFCVAIAVVAGLLGQYCSINSSSAHKSYNSVLWILTGFAVFLPVIHGLLYYGWGFMISYSMGSVVIFSFFLLGITLFLVEPSSRKPLGLLFILLLIFSRYVPGSFSYFPFLTAGIYEPLSCDPANFILSMIFLSLTGYFLWSGTVNKIRKSYY